MADGTITIDILMDDGSVKKGTANLKGLEGASNKADISIKSLVTSMGLVKVASAAFNVLKNSLDGAITRFDTLNAYPKIMKQMGYSTEDTNKSIRVMKDGIDGLPTSLQDITKSSQQFAILTGSAEQGAKTAVALNDAFLASGASAEDASRGVQQYSQMLSAGKVDMMSWRTLQETMPYALNETAKAFGYTGKSATNDLYKALQDGVVTMEEVNNKFIELDGGATGFAETAKTATGGIGTSFTNLKSSIVNGMTTILTKFDEVIKEITGKSIADNFNSLKVGINSTFKSIADSMDMIIPIIEKVKDSLDFTLIGYIIEDVTSILKSFWDSFSGGAGKGEVITLISNVFRVLHGVIQEVLQNVALFFAALNQSDVPELLGQAFSNLKDIIFETITFVKNFFGTFNGQEGSSKSIEIIVSVLEIAAKLFEKTTEAAKSFFEWLNNGSTSADVLKGAIVAIGVAIGGVLLYYKAWQTSINLITKAQKAWAAITKVNKAIHAAFNLVLNMNPIAAVVLAITALVGALVYWITQTESGQAVWKAFTSWLISTWSGMVKFFKGIWNGITDAFTTTVDTLKNLWDGVVQGAKDAVNGVKNTWNGIKDWFANLWQGTKDTASNAWDNVKQGASKAWEGTKSAWSSTKSWFGDVWGVLKESASLAWNSIVSTISPYVSTIIDIFNPMISFFTDLWKQIGDIAGAAWEVIKTVIMGPVLLLIDLITGDFNQLKEDATMLWNTLTQNVAAIVTGFVQIVTGYYTALKETLVNIWNQIVTIIQDAWLGFKVSITETTKTIIDGIVSLWNNLKQGSIDAYNAMIQWIKDVWSAFKTWITDTTKALVNGIVQGWNSFKQGTIDLWNATVQWIKDTWNNFKQWIKTTTDNLVNGVKQGWENLKQGTINIFNGLVNGAKQAWQNLKDSVDNVVQSVRNVFDTLRNIDLLDIGRAIIDGFVKGLKSAWESGMEFISGIGDWIREHKGPIRVDRKLLIPAGKAIMGGLNEGLDKSFKDVKSNISGMANRLSNSFDLGFDEFNLPNVSAEYALAGADGYMNPSQIVNNAINNQSHKTEININIAKAELANDADIEETGDKLAKDIERKSRGRLG